MVDTTPNLNKKLQGLQLIAQEKLQAIICSIPAKKQLILDKALIKPLEHVCTASWLKLKGIQRIYKYDPQQPLTRATDHVHIYMISSNLHLFQQLLQQLQVATRENMMPDSAGGYKCYHIVCVPSCFAYFHMLVEQEGLYGHVQLHRYNWDFVYLDQGVLSLEWPHVFGNVFLHRDSSMLPAIAQSLRVLQMVCGPPNLMLTFGSQSAYIAKMLRTLGNWSKQSTIDSDKSEFGIMLIIDRDKDYASALLTPTIYAGLLLEVFNQRTGEIQIESNTNKILGQKLPILLPPKQQQIKSTETTAKMPAKVTKPTAIRMNSQADEIYGDNRYRHFAQAITLVRAQAKSIGLEVQKLNDMKLDEMHDYVARKLPKITELKAKILRHLNACELIVEMLASNFRKLQTLEENILNNVARKRQLTEIEDLLTTDGQRENSLRILCLLHLCAGVAADELQQFIRNYCNHFGGQHLGVFQQLAKAGLLPELPIADNNKLAKSAKLLSNLPIPKFQQTEFQANANRLKLHVSTSVESAESLASNTCSSFVFNGMYIPLVAQLCSILLKCANAEELCAKLGMLENMEISLAAGGFEPMSVKHYASQVKNAQFMDGLPLRVRNVFVYVVGGVSYAEIGACDFLSRQIGAQIVMTSDSIIAGSDLIRAAF